MDIGTSTTSAKGMLRRMKKTTTERFKKREIERRRTHLAFKAFKDAVIKFDKSVQELKCKNSTG